MNTFVAGFVMFLILMTLIGVAAIVFLSMETVADPSPTSNSALSNRSNTSLQVRRVDTNTIETVSKQGDVQRWHRAL